MSKDDDAEIQDVKYDAAIYRNNVEWAQRGLIHRHILPYNVIQELQAAAELRARQHAESVMRPKWTRVCATHRWRRIVAQRREQRFNNMEVRESESSRTPSLARLVQILRSQTTAQTPQGQRFLARGFWRKQWSRMTLWIIRSWERIIACMASNTHHEIRRTRILAELRVDRQGLGG